MRTTISTLPGSTTQGPSTRTSASAPIPTISIGTTSLFCSRFIPLSKCCVYRATFAKWVTQRSLPLQIRIRADQGEAIPDLETLAQLLFFSAGVTKSVKHPQGETFFRAAACTGALYEIELYVICRDLRSKEFQTGETPALAAGVYHFGAAEFGLRQLRSGDFRKVIVDATANDPAVAQAPVIIICTGTYWRNAWKYRSRTYRHFGWDNGTILANLLANSFASKLPARVVTGFVDLQLNDLLGLDTKREVAFSVIPVGSTSSTPPDPPSVTKLELPIVAYSEREIDFPAMRKIHEASSLDTANEVEVLARQDPCDCTAKSKRGGDCAKAQRIEGASGHDRASDFAARLHQTIFPRSADVPAALDDSGSINSRHRC